MTITILKVRAACYLVMAAALCTGCTQTASAPATELVVTRVADGDTLTVADPSGRTTRVRLLGIDAPEVAHDGQDGECGADAAREALEDLVLHQDVTLVDDPNADRVDRYGRRLAYVELRGVDAALNQTEGGYAEAWYPLSAPQPERHTSYLRAQRAAQASGAGAWAHCATLGR